MFGGMPVYHRFGPKAWFIDNLLNQLDFLGDWRLWHFLLGAIGIFLLVKYLGMSSIIAFLASVAFVLMPHFQALIIVGHFAKFRALMWMPMVVLSVLYFMNKRTILSMLLLTLGFSMLFRTQHYQILFYTIMISVFLGVPKFYSLLKEKNWGEAGKTFGLVIIAAMLTLLIASQNFFSIKEYTPYSTRAGNAISVKMNQENQQENKGVGFDYATNWSYSIPELWNLLIPKFHGGTSNEKYTGDAVPAWKNRTLPTYWGDMTFTQSYEYLSVIILFLALAGIVFCWHRTEVKALTFVSILALLMSLGKHFAVLYRLFFYYVPYFDKFRVPMMILTMLMFTSVILAAYGLTFLLKADFSKKEIRQRFFIISGIFAVLLILPLLLGSTFSLSSASEVNRYGREIVDNLKKVRLDILQTSTIKTILYFGIAFLAVFASFKKWIPSKILPFILAGLIIIDFFTIDYNYVEGKFLDPEKAEQIQYAPTQIDKALMKDNSIFRVFPVGQLLQDTRWSYYYQSVGGYSPAKTQVIQEIIENNLYGAQYDQYGINWKVLDMLNAKYFVTNQPIQAPQLNLVARDENQKLFAYKNNDALPRAFFVGQSKEIKDGAERLKFMNTAAFDPEKMAIVEKPIAGIESPDSSSIKITRYEPEKIELNVYTDKQALLVLSEIYYPKGWSAKLDGNENLEIYKTNHLLRSVVVPAGEHKIVFSFHPTSYYTGLKISRITLYLVALLTLIFAYLELRKISVKTT